MLCSTPPEKGDRGARLDGDHAPPQSSPLRAGATRRRDFSRGTKGNQPSRRNREIGSGQRLHSRICDMKESQRTATVDDGGGGGHASPLCQRGARDT
ncbi:hypothetical protein VFPFJ_00202 [Purpureocillium lilacinum]|uniref:Uncharacterized protein n=1 Tax=Purpureocillium lilacinum TaxID=33203 RepID=A0A179HVP2_PURLI|nr:hypothetical protein VFPFJ_00202 [Purpureocillium lilacinum]OAQ94094.1 hypothetical protein VFPFJ_00202 [Purpureocillium lilacinum]